MKISKKQLETMVKGLIEEALIEEASSPADASTVAGTIIKDVYSTKDLKLKLNKSDITRYISQYNDPAYIPRLVKLGETFVKKLMNYNKELTEQQGNDILAAVGLVAGMVPIASKEKTKIKGLIQSLKVEQDKVNEAQKEDSGVDNEEKIKELKDEIKTLENE